MKEKVFQEGDQVSLDKTMAIMESLEAGKIEVKNLSSAAGSLNAIRKKQKNNTNNVKSDNTAVSSSRDSETCEEIMKAIWVVCTWKCIGG